MKRNLPFSIDAILGEPKQPRTAAPTVEELVAEWGQEEFAIIPEDSAGPSRAVDDFVAEYDCWEEDRFSDASDAEETDQRGGAHGFEEEEPEEEDLEVPEDLRPYVRIIGSRRTFVRQLRNADGRFGVAGFATQFCLNSLDQVDDVIALMERLIQFLIDKATERAEPEGFRGWFGIVLTTADGKTYFIPFRTPEQNTPDAISRAIETYDQSSKAVNFYGQRLTLEITVVNEPHGAGVRKGLNATKHLNVNMDAIVSIPGENDCLARAIAAAKYYWHLHEVRVAQGGKTDLLWRDVKRHVATDDLQRQANWVKFRAGLANVPADGINHAMAIQERLHRHRPHMYRIVIFQEGAGIKPMWKGPYNAQHNLYLYLHDNHYDVMKSPERFFGIRNYCVSCEVKFDKERDHSRKCEIRCLGCLRMGYGFPCQPETEFDGYDYVNQHQRVVVKKFPCQDCKRTFHNKDCFEAHKKIACKTFHYCCLCGVTYRVREHRKNGGHRCGERFCRVCKAFHGKKNGCYIRPSVATEVKAYRVVTLDFECLTNLKSRDARKLGHKPNYVVVMVTCTECMDDPAKCEDHERREDTCAACMAKVPKWKDLEHKDCKICGPVKRAHFSHWEHGDVVQAMLNFLFKDLPGDYKTFCYAHNGAKYDVQFIVDGLCKRGGRLPKIISTGNKIMQVWCPRSKHNNELIFRDTCLIFPMKLDDCTEAFELGISGKEFFAYGFNDPANYDVVLKGLPPKEYYWPDGMSPKRRAKFNEWWDEENARQQDFHLKTELGAYCEHDVWILLNAIVKFRQIFKELAGCDIFWKAVTSTSLFLTYFKTMYLKERQLAIVPNYGYGRHDRQSEKAMKFLKWFAWAHNTEVQHRDSPEGEFHVERSNFRLDGYVKAGARNAPGFQKCNWRDCLLCDDELDFTGQLALEFNGCQYHGCSTCFPNTVKLRTGKNSDEALQETEHRAKSIAHKGFTVISVQECHVDAELQRNEPMRQFFEECYDTGHINPREGLFGGRVGPTKMYYKPRADEEIKYFDIVSLYPYVLRNSFPLGHPTEVIRKFEHESWDSGWDREYLKYRGVFKVLLLPPQDLFFPVAPMKDDQRLLFQLCRSCSINSRKSSPYREPGCQHTDMERAYSTTLTHVELDLAFLHGYKVLRPIEVWHWHHTQWSDDIFRGYINDFLKMKVEASGWPEDLKNIADPEETQRAKDAFCQHYADMGVTIDQDNVKFNAPRRYIAKLALNSLWGRLALRNNKSHTELINQTKRLYELLYDASKEVTSITPLGDTVLRVSWQYKQRMEMEDENSNVVIAMFTTAYGRAELFKHMWSADERGGGPPGSKALYTDTDSVITVRKKGTEPIVNGQFLGEMTDEHPGEDILEYVSGGNKQYGLLLRDKIKGTIRTTQKIRGISLDTPGGRALSYEVMRDMVLGQRERPEITLRQEMIHRDATFKVSTMQTEKVYRPIFRKGWIDANFNIFPYGFVRTKEAVQSVATYVQSLFSR